MRLRSLQEIQDWLDKDFAWRLREIDDLKKTARTTQKLRQAALLRAGTPLLYAHFEGFVKASTEAYLNHVAFQRRRIDELEMCLVLHCLRDHLDQLQAQGKRSRRVESLRFIQSQMHKRAQIKWRGAARTRSNLSFDVFTRVADLIGISPLPYQTREKFINKSLLERRNRIAHGEYLDLDENSFQKLADGVISLLRQYKTDIENKVCTKAYLAL